MSKVSCKVCGVAIDYRSTTGLCHKHYIEAGGMKLQIPADFSEYARGKDWRQLTTHYKISRSTLTLWRRETAIAEGRRVPWSDEDDNYLRANYGRSAIADVASYLGRSPESTKSRARFLGIQRRRTPPQLWKTSDRMPKVSGRVKGVADMAAEFIRGYDRVAIYRCDPDGRPNPKASHWKYGFGSVVLTENELLAKAERKGWSPDEWKRLAA